MGRRARKRVSHGWEEEVKKNYLTDLRDTYADDKAAASVLDLVLTRHKTADPVERARALAMRAELAGIALTKEERDRWAEELGAADRLEKLRSGAAAKNT